MVKKLDLNLQYYRIGQVKKTELYKSSPIRAEVLSVKDSSAGSDIQFVRQGQKLFTIEGEKRKPVDLSRPVQAGNVTYKVYANIDDLTENNIYGINWQPIINVAAHYAGSLNIHQPIRDANILQISIATEDPQKGVDILNQLVPEYNASNLEKKNRVIDNTLDFIDERLSLLSGELGKVESGLQQYRQANEITDVDKQSSAGISEVSQTFNQLQDADVKLQVIDMVRESVGNPSRSFSTAPTLGINDPTLLSMVQQYNGLQVQREELLKTMPAANPAVRSAEGQIEKLRGGILENLNNIKNSTSQQRNRLRSEYDMYRSRLRAVPRQERQLLEINRQASVKENLFKFLLQKREEAAITRASVTEASAPLDPAVASWAPISPDKSKTYRMAIIIGILIPIGLIYLKELLNDKVITQKDISSVTAAPIIGEIMNNPDNSVRKIVVGYDDRTVLAEQFRMLRTNIPFLVRGNDKKIILFTSSNAGEGKTFCSLNLAAALAVAGKKTVLVEMDLRKPKVAESLGIPSSLPGITHYIAGQASLKELPIPYNDLPNLFIVSAGAIPPNPSEILVDERIGEMLGYLEEKFDFVIIDSAPIGLVSDAKIVADHVDVAIYVVRQRTTHKKSIRLVNEIYQDKVFKNLCVLVNDVKSSGASSYYGYNRGTYGYGYAYGAEPKRNMWQKMKNTVGF
ncbi:polysaccharide biosynthesis tyrosine autokinase [Aridibaculum aurantiacum]|uniref:polysaccharide biosynthesis tyrosine autokinase n=1 Tax=Aridibaculum aurantiacum TaxID=2810307 RepID=UPI001A95A6F1